MFKILSNPFATPLKKYVSADLPLKLQPCSFTDPAEIPGRVSSQLTFII